MADPKIAAAVGALERALARFGRHMVIGGIAVIARGVRRLTDDLDVALWADGVDLDALLLRLAREDVTPRIADAAPFARQSQVLLLRHRKSGIDIDLSLASLPFEDAALDRAEPVTIGRRRVRVAMPGDLIVYKAVAARERDRSDVERLLEIHGSAIDVVAVRRTVDELARALERPDLVDNLDLLIRKTRAARERPRSVARKRISKKRP